jgi:hypothetical protein
MSDDMRQGQVGRRWLITLAWGRLFPYDEVRARQWTATLYYQADGTPVLLETPADDDEAVCIV